MVMLAQKVRCTIKERQLFQGVNERGSLGSQVVGGNKGVSCDKMCPRSSFRASYAAWQVVAVLDGRCFLRGD